MILAFGGVFLVGLIAAALFWSLPRPSSESVANSENEPVIPAQTVVTNPSQQPQPADSQASQSESVPEPRRPPPLIFERELKSDDGQHGTPFDDLVMSWSTSFGPGEWVAPPLESPADAVDEGLTRIEAVVIDPAVEGRVLFIGENDPKLVPLSRRELIDGLVTAYRALSESEPPGVSIDPRPEQFVRQLQAGDEMDVVYYGSTAGTRFGWAAFESDRLMKCLSLGKDNETDLPFRSSVAGYDQLKLVDSDGGLSDQGYRRFWIDISRSDVAVSADGRSFLVKSALEIRTQNMIVTNGELVPGPPTTSKAATEFATHMTTNYAGYEAEFSAFHHLAMYSTLTGVADAIGRADSCQELRETLEPVWLQGSIRMLSFETPQSTKAIGARHDVSETQAVVRVGGVTLEPKSKLYEKHPRAAEMLRLAAASALENQQRTAWEFRDDRGVTQRVVAARPYQEGRLRQSDLSVGTLQFDRDYAHRSSTDSAKAWQWVFRRPQLVQAKLTKKIVDLGSLPRHITLQVGGEEIRLVDCGMLTMPGNQPTPGFLDAVRERRLFFYTNQWIYLDGPVEFVSINGGPPAIQLGENARMIRFSPKEEEGHRVEQLMTQGDTIDYAYQNGELVTISNKAGDSIALRYDGSGHLSEARGSNGSRTRYRYDGDGRIKHVANQQGEVLGYSYDTQGRLSAVEANFIGSRVDSAGMHQATLNTRKPSPPLKSHDGKTVYVELTPRSDDVGYRLQLSGIDSATGKSFTSDSIDSLDVAKSLADYLRSHGIVQHANALVLTGEAAMCDHLGTALRETMAAERLAVFATTDPQRAERNLHGSPAANGESQVVVFEQGLFPQVIEPLQRHAGGPSDAGALILVAHNTPGFMEMVHEMGRKGELKDRDVILLTCATESLPGQVEHVLNHYAPRSVTGFSNPIDQSLLPALVAGIRRGVRKQHQESSPNAYRKDFGVQGVLKETIERIRRQEEEELPPAIEDMETEYLKFFFERVDWKLDRLRLPSLVRTPAIAAAQAA